MPVVAIQSFLSAPIILTLGFFVYFHNKNFRLNAVFLLFSLCVFWWLVFFGFANLQTETSKADLLFKVGAIGVIFIPVTGYHLVALFLKNRTEKPLVIFSYLIGAVFVYILLFTNFFVLKIHRFFWGLYPIGGRLHPFYMAFLLVLVFRFVYLLMKNYEANASNGVERNRAKYLLLAMFFFSFAALDFLPNYNLNVYPFGFAFTLIYSLLMAYAIVRHRLLEIEIVIRKTLIFGGIFLVAYGVFSIIALMGQSIFQKVALGNRWIALIPSAIIIALLLRPLENFLINITDKYLFQKKYDYRALLKVFTTQILTTLDLGELIRLTTEKLADIIRITSCTISIGDDGQKMPDTDVQAATVDKPLVTFPLVVHGKRVGVLSLGKKKSDEAYRQDELDMLFALAQTLAIAVSNAQLFAELSKAQIEAAEKEKLASIGTLTTCMAHEIRNPLTTIRIFSEYLHDKLADAEFVAKYKKIVIAGVEKIDHIIQAMVDFSADHSRDEERRASLSEAVDELVSFLGINIELAGRVDIIKDVPAGLPMLSVDRKELDEIILNLTQNAIQAIRGQGKVTLRAFEQGDVVVLEISDTGCGMSGDLLKHVFSPFFTTKSKGFGLGLFVVNELVKRNDGIISVSSQMGNGTTFHIEFKKV